MTEEGHVKKIKGITPLRRLCRGFGIDATGGRKELVERIINHLDLRPDYESLYAAENFTCKADPLEKRPDRRVSALHARQGGRPDEGDEGRKGAQHQEAGA